MAGDEGTLKLTVQTVLYISNMICHRIRVVMMMQMGWMCQVVYGLIKFFHGLILFRVVCLHLFILWVDLVNHLIYFLFLLQVGALFQLPLCSELLLDMLGLFLQMPKLTGQLGHFVLLKLSLVSTLKGALDILKLTFNKDIVPDESTGGHLLFMSSLSIWSCTLLHIYYSLSPLISLLIIIETQVYFCLLDVQWLL